MNTVKLYSIKIIREKERVYFLQKNSNRVKFGETEFGEVDSPRTTIHTDLGDLLRPKGVNL